MDRPMSFSDVVGHDWIIEYFTTHIRNNTLPQFIIMEGPEGVGKTSLADLVALSLVYGLEDSDEKAKAMKNVVLTNGSNDYIKRYKCSVDGGREVAKDILAEMTNSFMLDHKKVIICDECHNFLDSAQDVFLADTEFMKKDVYLLMMTTDVQKLKASLRSRAVSLHLYPLKQSDMMKVLKKEVAERRLRVQSEDATLQLICEWSECKPRTGLSMLKAFADGDAVSSNMIRDMIGVLDVSDVLPILESLSGSMTFGLNYIMSMKVSDSIVPLVAECFKIKSGSPSYKVQFNQIAEIKTRLNSVSTEQLITFLQGITKFQTLNRSGLINAFINAHGSRALLGQADTRQVLGQELAQKQEVTLQERLNKKDDSTSFSIDDLLANADVVVK